MVTQRLGRRNGRVTRLAILGAVAAFAGGAAAGAAPWEPPDDVATRPPVDAGTTSIDLRPSGNLHKELGEPAGLTTATGEGVYFEITVRDIAVRTSCPGRGVQAPPRHGYFVVVDLQASMSDKVEEVVGGADVFMPLTADAFAVVAADGTRTTATLTDASWSCFEDDALAAPFVGPGETTSGSVVLDSPVASGTLVYAPGGVGWEWDF